MESLRESGAATIRRQIIELLTGGSMGARELSQELHQSEKEIYAHLDHIGRSLKPVGKKLVIEPPACLSCGFLFEDRDRPQPPGRCPRCKKTHIRRPRYRIG